MGGHEFPFIFLKLFKFFLSPNWGWPGGGQNPGKGAPMQTPSLESEKRIAKHKESKREIKVRDRGMIYHFSKGGDEISENLYMT